jgi:hypothetical protein
MYNQSQFETGTETAAVASSGCIVQIWTMILVVLGSGYIAIQHFRQHRLENKFARGDFAAIALREWNDKVKERVVANCKLNEKPLFTIKDGDDVRQWFKVIDYKGPGVRPQYIERISPNANLEGVIYAAFSGKDAQDETKRWLAKNGYSEADKEWTTYFRHYSGTPNTNSISPTRGESEICIWASAYSLEKVYLWNGSAVYDMSDNAVFFTNLTTAIQKLEH